MIHNTYIDVSVPITAASMKAFTDCIVDKVPDGTKVLHLLLNSPGGSVPVALGVANFLEGLPCKVVTYNMSRVDSAAILLYAAGEERVCLPEARFFAHSIQIELSGQYSLTSLGNEYKNLRNDFKNVVSYLSNKTGIRSSVWRRYMSDAGHLFSAEEALKRGLASKIACPDITTKDLLLTIGCNEER